MFGYVRYGRRVELEIREVNSGSSCLQNIYKLAADTSALPGKRRREGGRGRGARGQRGRPAPLSLPRACGPAQPLGAAVRSSLHTRCLCSEISAASTPARLRCQAGLRPLRHLTSWPRPCGPSPAASGPRGRTRHSGVSTAASPPAGRTELSQRPAALSGAATPGRHGGSKAVCLSAVRGS